MAQCQVILFCVRYGYNSKKNLLLCDCVARDMHFSAFIIIIMYLLIDSLKKLLVNY